MNNYVCEEYVRITDILRIHCLYYDNDITNLCHVAHIVRFDVSLCFMYDSKCHMNGEYVQRM